MSRTSTQSKMKYNRNAYRRYEFNVNVNTMLNYLLEDYMKEKSLSSLIKMLLCDHFEIGMNEVIAPHRMRDNNNNENGGIRK